MSNFKRSGTTGGCRWFFALLLSALLAGCGGGGGGGGGGAVGGGTGGSSTVFPGAAGTPGAQATDPTVGSASPGNLTTNIQTSTNSPNNIVTGTLLTATFTQAMDPLTVTAPGTFTLKVANLANTDVPGTVTMNAANTVATFTPTAGALAANTKFKATVSTAAKSALPANTAMAKSVAWTFTTNLAALTRQAPLVLGKAGTFAIFSNTAVTSVFPSNVKGNVGTAGTGSATTITCPEVTAGGSVFTVDATFANAVCNTNDSVFVGAAAGDMALAITDAKTRVIPDSVDNQTGVAGNISGLVLAPGLYKWTTGVLIDNTGITITGSADDVWIFQIAGDLTVQDNAIITLGGGALAKNIFWQVGGVTGAIIGSAVAFKGIVLADAGITLTAGSTVNGRLFANPAITLITNTITPPAP